MKRLVLHPTDLSPQSELAFIHALKISLNDKSGMYILHVGNNHHEQVNWDDYPKVRETLHKWGEIPADTDRQSLHDQLGLDIKKVEANTKDVVNAVVHFRKQHHFGIDLMVISTEGRDGLPRWLKPSISEEIARKASVHTLYIPHKAKGFVNPENGVISLENILIAIDHSPPAQIGITETAEFLRKFTQLAPSVTLLNIGPENDCPVVNTNVFNHLDCTYLTKTGNIVEEIIDTANTIEADLIVMTSHGHDGFLDVMRGSVTERVLHESTCPLLMIPAN